MERILTEPTTEVAIRAFLEWSFPSARRVRITAMTRGPESDEDWNHECVFE